MLVFRLPEGPVERENTWELLVEIENKYKEIESTTFAVKVSQGAAEEQILDAASDMIQSSNFKEPSEANTVIMTVSLTLNKGNNDDSTSSNIEKKKALRNEMCQILEWSTNKLKQPEEIYQTSATIEVVTEVPSQINKVAQSSAVIATSRASSAIAEITKDPNVPQAAVIHASEGLVRVSSNVMESIHLSRFEEKDDYSASTVSGLTNGIVGSLGNLSEGVLRRMLPGEPPVNISTHGVSMQLERTSTDGVANKTIQLQSGRFSLPSAETMFGDDNYDTVDLKVIEYKRNPFTWDKTSEIQSSVISVEIYGGNSTMLKQTNTSDDFTFTINHVRHDDTDPSPDDVPDLSLLDDVEPTTQYSVFNITSNTTAVRMYVSVSESSNATFTIDMKYDGLPEDDDFDLRSIVPEDVIVNGSEWDTPNSTTCNVEPSVIPRQVKEYEGIAKNAKTFEVFIPAECVPYIGIYYVLISEFRGINETTGYPILDRPSHPFTLTIHTATCQYWNDEQDHWQPDGCRVDPLSTPEETICHCNHLTNFGIDSFYVPINTIEWDVAFANFARLDENPVVFVTVCIIIVVYVILVIFLRRKDKDDLLKVC
ncbi:polycystin-1-like protein 2 [Glandiceps talaboti]